MPPSECPKRTAGAETRSRSRRAMSSEYCGPWYPSHVRGLAMAAQVRREDMPAQAQRWNHWQKYLPPPAESMQQHKRRPMGSAFGIVQANFAGIEDALNEAWMVFSHDAFAHNIHLLDSPARGAAVVSQFAADPGFEHLDFADLDGINGEHVVTQQYHVRQLPRSDRTFFVLLKFRIGRTHRVGLDRFFYGQLLFGKPSIRILAIEGGAGCGRVQREHGIQRRDTPIGAQCEANAVVK